MGNPDSYSIPHDTVTSAAAGAVALVGTVRTLLDADGDLTTPGSAVRSISHWETDGRTVARSPVGAADTVGDDPTDVGSAVRATLGADGDALALDDSPQPVPRTMSAPSASQEAPASSSVFRGLG
ncbi:hypothetical protein [Frankia sp. Cas4]|uniref:hypothetical protein n=1 Tax=Frankia sp. Cas4 TaxID=3073927 RepID=UPI002AD54175|nr:hypothetical protein [Frankia sp. Cas4]